MIAGSAHIENTLGLKLQAYFELLKARLSVLVAFSCGFGYVLGSGSTFMWMDLLLVCFGGFLVSGSSLVINQILEKDYDKLMKRTSNRPLPTKRVTVIESWIYATVLGVLGLGLLYVIANPLTVALSLLSLLLYSFAYTPAKRVGSIAVFIGAIPGALPPLLGWVAATGSISHEALIIFGIQFIWQFPHFWAIAWIADEDYKKAGFKLLPGQGKKDFKTAVQIMIYTLFLLPLGLLPVKFGISGIDSGIVATLCGVLFLSQTFSLMTSGSEKAAKRIMYSSFLYLPIVQLAYLIDKV